MIGDAPFAFFIRVLNDQKIGYAESEELDQILRHVCEQSHLRLDSARDFSTTGRITEQVLRAIHHADVVFADINTSNENIWYELGFAHAIGLNKVICLVDSNRPIPFDIADYIAIQYKLGLTAQRELEKKVSKMLSKILGESAIFRLIKQDHWESSIPEYLSRFPELSNQYIQILKSLANDITQAQEIRNRAIYTLLNAGVTDADLLEKLSHPLVSVHIRRALFQALMDIDCSVSESVLLNGLKENLDDGIKSYVARSSVNQWLKGYLNIDFLNTYLLFNEDWVIPKQAAIALLSSGNERGLEPLSILADDRRVGVIKRFADFVTDIEEGRRSFSKFSQQVFRTLKQKWKGAESISKTSILKRISKIEISNPEPSL